MKRLAITLVMTLGVMFSGCVSDENFAFDGCHIAYAKGVRQLSCGRILVPITLHNGDHYLSVNDDGDDEFTLYMAQRDHEYGTDSVPVIVSYLGGGSFFDQEKLYNVDILAYRKNGEDVFLVDDYAISCVDDYPVPH